MCGVIFSATNFLAILTVEKFENCSIFDEVIRITEVCQIFGPPISKLGIAIIASKYNIPSTNSSRDRFITPN